MQTSVVRTPHNVHTTPRPTGSVWAISVLTIAAFVLPIAIPREDAARSQSPLCQRCAALCTVCQPSAPPPLSDYLSTQHLSPPHPTLSSRHPKPLLSPLPLAAHCWRAPMYYLLELEKLLEWNRACSIEAEPVRIGIARRLTLALRLRLRLRLRLAVALALGPPRPRAMVCPCPCPHTSCPRTSTSPTHTHIHASRPICPFCDCATHAHSPPLVPPIRLRLRRTSPGALNPDPLSRLDRVVMDRVLRF